MGLKLQQCRTLSSSLASYKTALENFASGLTTVKSDLAGVREKATAGGLTVEGEKVMEPQAPPPLPENNPVERDKDRQTHQTLVDNYNTRRPCTIHCPPRPVISASRRPKHATLLLVRAPRSLTTRCGRSSRAHSSRTHLRAELLL